MSDGGTVWIWTAAILAGSVGFAVGYLVAYFAGLRDQGADHLREQLARQQQEFEAHRSRVDDHFVRTSELFQDMTRQYGALYEHLASGAQSLCSDRLVTHRPQVPENTPMVEHKRDATAAKTAPAAPSGAADVAQQPAPESTPAPESADNDAQRPPAVDETKTTRTAAIDDAELESFAPRPETAHLHDPESTPETSKPGIAEETHKPRLH